MAVFGGRGKSKEDPMAAQNAPKRAPGATPGGVESTIGPNTYVKGDIQGDGGLRIEGVVEGNIELTGNLLVTESAKVRAEIKASNISIAGAVQGNITATRVDIMETGRVWGDLTVKSLLVNEGAYFRGQTFMPQDMKPPQLEPPKTAFKTQQPPAIQAGSIIDVDPGDKGR